MVRRYAETWAKRYGNAELWQGERQRTSDKNWRQPIRWNYEAADENRRRRVFCASRIVEQADHNAANAFA